MLTFFHNMEDHSSHFQVASTAAAHTHEQQMLTICYNIEDYNLVLCEYMINPFLVLKLFCTLTVIFSILRPNRGRT
jgi:hypothetical protein